MSLRDSSYLSVKPKTSKDNLWQRIAKRDRNKIYYVAMQQSKVLKERDGDG